VINKSSIIGAEKYDSQTTWAFSNISHYENRGSESDSFEKIPHSPGSACNLLILELIYTIAGRGVAKLVARLLAYCMSFLTIAKYKLIDATTAALWVRIQTFIKNTKWAT
jgi:hypothetical protein